MRRGLVLLWVSALVTTLVASAGAHAAVADKAKANRVPVLRRTTTFTASTTSRFVFEVPRDIRGSSLRMRFSGDGRVTGALIAELGKIDSEAMLQAYSIGECDSAGCKPDDDPLQFWFPSLGRFVEAGRYQLIVLADTAPVTVTLGTKELAGKAAYRGGEPIMSEVVTLPVGTVSQAQSNVFSAGNFVSWEDRTPDLGIFGLWMYADSHAATAFGDCAYASGSITPPAELNETAFLPGCPTGDGVEFDRVSDSPGGKAGEIFVSARWGNPIGLGGWFSTAGQVTSHGAVAMWIDFDGS